MSLKFGLQLKNLKGKWALWALCVLPHSHRETLRLVFLFYNLTLLAHKCLPFGMPANKSEAKQSKVNQIAAQRRGRGGETGRGRDYGRGQIRCESSFPIFLFGNSTFIRRLGRLPDESQTCSPHRQDTYVMALGNIWRPTKGI